MRRNACLFFIFMHQRSLLLLSTTDTKFKNSRKQHAALHGSVYANLQTYIHLHFGQERCVKQLSLVHGNHAKIGLVTFPGIRWEITQPATLAFFYRAPLS